MTLTLESISKEVDGRSHIYTTDLQLEKGTINVLLGPTLAGKTTLMRLMAGLDKPSSGRILFDGVDVTDQRIQDREVAMVYQQFINYPSLTVYENIASPLRIQRKSRKAIDEAVHRTADLLKLTPLLNRKPLALSGGQQQRCALARALVKGAKLVLLDEPLANLDYKLREELRVEIPAIFRESGAIFVYATTEPEEALLLGGNTATMFEGKITQFGETAKVYRQPQNAITAKLFSDPPMNFIAVEKSAAHWCHSNQKLPVGHVHQALPDGCYQLGFRPNHVRLGEVQDNLHFPAKVAVSEITGSESFVHFEHQAERYIALLSGVHEFAPGAEVQFSVDPERAFVFSEQGDLVQGQEGLERVV